MTSLTSTAHAPTPGARHGRSRAALVVPAQHPIRDRSSSSRIVARAHVPHPPRVGPGRARPGDTVSRDMFHPVGSQPPSVYWRRRWRSLGTLLILLVLLVVTARVLLGGDGAAGAAGRAAASSSPACRRPPAPRPRRVQHDARTHVRQHRRARASPTPSASTFAVHHRRRKRVRRSELDGAGGLRPQPTLHGRRPAEADAAGDQHRQDARACRISPTRRSSCASTTASRGSGAATTARCWPGTTTSPCCPARRCGSRSSGPGCPRARTARTPRTPCGPRQVVGAGTYTLYAYLAGEARAAPSQFSIS